MWTIICLVLSASFPFTVSQELPTVLHALKCYPEDPQYQYCFQEGVKLIPSYLLQGIPSINLPKLDPLYVETFRIHEKFGEDSIMALTFTDIILRGATTLIRAMKISEINFDIRGFTITGTQQYLYINAMHYKSKGYNKTFTFNNEGTSIIIFEDLNLRILVRLRVVKGEAYDYFQIRQIRIPTLTFKKYNISLTPANPSLANNTQELENLFRDNPKIIRELVGNFGYSIGKITMAQLNPVLEKIATDSWFSS